MDSLKEEIKFAECKNQNLKSKLVMIHREREVKIKFV